jgi:hypothetical protein
MHGPLDGRSVLRTSLLSGAVAAATFCLGGCAGFFESTFAPDGAAVSIEGLGDDPRRLDGVLPFGSYAVLPSESSLVAGDVPLEDLLTGEVRNGQFLHAQLLWIPKPGMTPVDPTAMNVVLRYVIVVDGAVGVYGGGGFAWPRGTPGEGPVTLSLRGSSLSLLAATEGFVDPLTPAEMTGTIALGYDPESTRRYRRGMSQLVTNSFGAARWVDGSERPLDLAHVLAIVAPSETHSAAIASSASSTSGATEARPGS